MTSSALVAERSRMGTRFALTYVAIAAVCFTIFRHPGRRRQRRVATRVGRAVARACSRGLSNDGFVAAYSSGGVRAYSTYLGGSAEDKATAVALQPGKGIHIAGNTQSPNFPVLSPLPNQNSARGSQDGFVVRSPILDLNMAVPASSWRAALFLAGVLLGVSLLRVTKQPYVSAR